MNSDKYFWTYYFLLYHLLGNNEFSFCPLIKLYLIFFSFIYLVSHKGTPSSSYTSPVFPGWIQIVLRCFSVLQATSNSPPHSWLQCCQTSCVYIVFESESANCSVLSLCDPIDCSLPGSSVNGLLQARILVAGSHSLLQGIFPTQWLNLGLLHCRQIFYHLTHQGLLS